MKKRKKVFDLGYYDQVKDCLSSSLLRVSYKSSIYSGEVFFNLDEFDLAFAKFIREKYFFSTNDVAFAVVTLSRVSAELFDGEIVYEAYVRKPGNRS